MRRKLRKLVRVVSVALLVGAAVVLALAVALLAAVHLPPVQRGAWNRAIRAIEKSTGWQVAAEQVRARLLWAPKLEISDLTVGSAGQTAATAGRVAVSFRWRSLLSDPPRIESVEIADVAVDLRGVELPHRPPSPPVTEALNPWRAVEIGSLSVRGVSAGAAVVDVDLELSDASISGALEDGNAGVKATVGSIGVTRAGRRLVVGPLDIAASANERGAAVERLSLDGLAVSGSVELEASFADARAQGTGRVEVDLRSLLEWYDPDLAILLEPRGRLQLTGGGSGSLGGEFEVTVDHVGEPIEVAGYPIERLHVASTGRETQAEASAGSWGELSAELAQGQASLHARLIKAATGPAIVRFAGPMPGWIPGPITLDGTLDASTPMPPILEQVGASMDLRAVFPGGRAELRGEGSGLTWRADRFALELPGGHATGRGSIEGGKAIQAAFTVEVQDPAILTDHLSRWVPDIDGLGVAGGPAVIEAAVTGSMSRPMVEASFAWERPEVSGVTIERVEGSATGGLEEISWRVAAVPVDGASVALTGVANGRQSAVSGTWLADLPDLEPLALLVQPALAGRVGGSVGGSGTFRWDAGVWGVSGGVRAEQVRFDQWELERADLDFLASPESVEVERLELRVLGGTVSGSGGVDLARADRAVHADLRWEGLDPSELPIALPAEAGSGRLDGALQVSGELAAPTGQLQLTWAGTSDTAVVRSGSLHAMLIDGEIQLTSDGLDTAAGPLVLTAIVPLGDVPRPVELWPGAPHGPLELTVAGSGLDFAAMATALGRGPLPVDVESDLSLRLRWSLSDPLDRLGQLLLDGFVIRHTGGEVTAPDGISVRLDGGVFVLELTRLVGPRAVVQVAGEFDPETLDIRLEVDGQLSPEIAQVIPYPVRIREPITIRASVAGPLAAPEGTVVIDHRGGTVVLRDPPVELTDLHLAASLSGGALWIDDGSAGVNRGQVQFGGGWDPASGQGLVVELESVTFFALGTLTRWSGLLAIEPDPESAARVAGDLVLDGGVWEQPADVAGAFLAGAELEPAADDPLRGIALDLTVRARTGIRVDNNLGRFDVRWDRLRVGGTAAQPVIRGDVRIAPGGVVNLPGKRVELQRGTIRFTGDPSVDPVLELVPVENLATYGGGVTGDQSGIDTYTLAAQTLYGGVGRALGFENETLQPAQIAVETETDTSSQFLLGQRLSPNLAFFFATNPTDVQDRTTMLQLWNLDFDPGLAVQAYQKTLEERSGITALQRFQWGGSAGRVGLPFSRGASATADRPIIHKVRLEGDWPVSKRQLKRASGLRRGLPYDPFLDFVAEVHLEQRLAAEGYPEAEVRGRIEGSERSPTVVYACDPGQYHDIGFAGDEPSGRVQREVRALYMPPPLETFAIDNMRDVLVRHYQSIGFPFASVEAEREDDRLILGIVKGEPLEYRGPVVEGVPERGARLIRDVLGSPAELAAAVEDPDRAGRVVASALAGIGYTDARLVQVTTRPIDTAAAEVHLAVDPGEVARIAELEVKGQDPLGLTETFGDAVAVGAELDRRVIDDRMAEIRRGYQQSGYDQASVRAIPRRREDGSWLVIVELEPGVRRELSDVQFNGLRHINPRYLRPGLQLADGDILNVFEVDESAIRIANFAPVERLEVTTRPSGTGGSVVDFEVFEKPRWTVELGLGWDNDRGLEVRSGLRDDNLFGRGVGANLRLSSNRIERVALLYGSLPPLPGSDLSFAGTVGYKTGEGVDLNDDIQEEEYLASVEAIYQLAPTSSLKGYYRISKTMPSSDDPEVDFFLSDVTVATVGSAFAWDRTDNMFDPRSGYSVVTDLGWSSSYLGSDLNSVSAVVNASLAVQPHAGWTWVQTGRIGVSEPLQGSELTSEVKFYAGGQGSIRGFDFNSIGPYFETTQGPSPLGGGAMFILNEELRMPLWKSLRGAVFIDSGQIWESWGEADTELSMAVGLGLRWSTPIGLVWGDVAWPVANVGFSSRDLKFYFGIGRPF